MCLAMYRRTVLPLFPRSFFSLCYVFQTTQQGLLIRFWHSRDAERIEIISHLCVILFKETESSESVFWAHTQKQAQSKTPAKILEEPPVMLWSELRSVKVWFHMAVPYLTSGHKLSKLNKKIIVQTRSSDSHRNVVSRWLLWSIFPHFHLHLNSERFVFLI